MHKSTRVGIFTLKRGIIAGCAAVLRQTLVESGISKPSAARIKVLLINGAGELAVQDIRDEAGSSLNNNSGPGRVNLANSVVIVGQTPNASCGEGSSLIQRLRGHNGHQHPYRDRHD
jgi:serine protease AprX